MARRILLSLLIPLSAGTAWYLRGGQLSLSFADPTQWDWALWGLLGAVALLTLLLSFPEKHSQTFTDYRAVPLGAVLQGAGALLVMAGGAWQLCRLYPALQSLQTVTAAAMLLGGLGLFGGMAAFLGGNRRVGGFLLLSLCAAGVYLVLTYLEIASDPRLLRFDMRMLAIGGASLSLCSLCSLLFGMAGRRWFLLFSALTVPLSVAALYTTEAFPQALSLMGCALAAFGFFLSVLFGIPARKKQTYELVEDPFRTGSVRRDEIPRAEAELAAAETETASSPAAQPAPAEKAEPSKPVSMQETPAAPAAAPASQPAKEDDFDLARVDRLLRELGVEDSKR